MTLRSALVGSLAVLAFGTAVGTGVVLSGATASEDATARPAASPMFALKDRVVFEPHGVSHGWRLTAVVRDYDRRFARLDLMIGDCATHPNAGCVQVREVRKPRATWWGLWSYRGNFHGTIQLNTTERRDRFVTCHEVGHALGLHHHINGPGCLRKGAEVKATAHRASLAEMRALRTAYANYCRGTYLC